jgi:hypothetical protein
MSGGRSTATHVPRPVALLQLFGQQIIDVRLSSFAHSLGICELTLPGDSIIAMTQNTARAMVSYTSYLAEKLSSKLHEALFIHVPLQPLPI